MTHEMKDAIAHMGVLLANLDYMCDVVGEELEGEDALLVANARTFYEAAKVSNLAAESAPPPARAALESDT